MDDVLKSTGTAVEQIIIEPDGKWAVNSKPDTSPKPNGASSGTDDDEDLVEIKDMRVASLKEEVPYTPLAMSRTPPSSSREPSIVSGSMRSSNNKRPIGQVIDLTFSDDDEDEPPRAAKRQQHSNIALHSALDGDSRHGYAPASARANAASPRVNKLSSLSTHDSACNYRDY